MNFKLITFLIIILICPQAGMSQSIEQNESTQFPMQGKIGELYREMIDSESTERMRGEILSITDKSEQVRQLLLVMINASGYPDIRSDLANLLYELPSQEDLITPSNLVLFSRIYVLAVLHPEPQRYFVRGYFSDGILRSRILETIGNILKSNDDEAMKVPDLPPLERLKLLFLHAANKNSKFPDLIEKIDECQHMIEAAEIEIANGPPRDIEEKDLQWNESKTGESESVLKANIRGTRRDVGTPEAGASTMNHDFRNIITWVTVGIILVLCFVAYYFIRRMRI